MDLDPQTRRLMALGATSRYFGRGLLEQALQQKLPRTPFRDWAWRWWNVLRLSSLEDKWDKFSALAQDSNLREASEWLRRSVSNKKYQEVLRRAGTNPYNVHRKKRKARTGRVLWTKGGCWREESPYTKLLVLKQPLPQRALVKNWQRRLGHAAVAQIERELMRLINPDVTFRLDAIDRAQQYVSRRIPEMLNYPKRRTVGPVCLAWFFHTRIRVPGRGTVAPLGSTGYFRHYRKRGKAPEW